MMILNLFAGAINPTWLTYLCIAFGVLFAIMLLINIFLCSAMTCSCTKVSKANKTIFGLPCVLKKLYVDFWDLILNLDRQ